MTLEQNIDYENLSKIEKLAYLFVALGPETSAPLLKQLNDDIIQQVCRHMANIHVVPNDLKKRLVKEFALLIANKMGDTLNNEEQVKKLLTLAQGDDKAKDTWNNALQDPVCLQMAKTFEQLDPVKIYDTIKYEQTQTIAFILTCIPPKRATTLLNFFDKEKQESILLSIGTMQPIPISRMREILQMFIRLCENNIKKDDKKENVIDGGPASVANLLNALKKDDKKALLEDLEKKNTDFVKSVQKYLFTFEDLITLTKEDLQKIIRDVDTNDLIYALKGASQELLTAVLKSMSKRAADSLKEELEDLGPVKMKEVESARDKIVAVVRQLETNGQLALGGGDEDELMLP